MSEEFWYTLWRMIVIGLCIFTAIIAGCNVAIGLSSDPLAAACASGISERSCWALGRK